MEEYLRVASVFGIAGGLFALVGWAAHYMAGDELPPIPSLWPTPYDDWGEVNDYNRDVRFKLRLAVIVYALALVLVGICLGIMLWGGKVS